MTIPLSWASLEVFQDCKLRWKLQYLDGIRLPVNQKPFLVGSAVHDTLEGWYRAGWEPDFVQANIQRIFTETVRERRVRLSNDETRTYGERAARAARIAESIYLQMEFPHRDVSVETRFDVDYLDGRAKLRGAWDVLDPTRSTILDLKTSVATPSGKPGQLLTYGVAAALRGMVATEGAFIYPLLSPKIVPVPLSEQRLAAHRQVLDNMVMDIASGRVGWNPSTGSHCLRCPYYRTPHCPATLREEVLKDDGEITRE